MLEKLPLELIDKWAKNNIILLRKTSKYLKEQIDNIQEPLALTINSKWFRDPNNGNITEKHNIIFNGIKSFKSISKLILNNCRIEIFKIVLFQPRSITYLDLSSNHCGLDAKKLVNMIKQCTSLLHLNLHYNKIETEGACSLAIELNNCKKLTHFNIGANLIGSIGIKKLIEVLTKLPIEFLNISNIRLESEGIEYLKNLKSKTLINLNLCKNMIKTDDTIILAQMIRQCPNLVNINLSYNFIESNGLYNLSKEFKLCPNLAYLDLGYNLIGPDSIESFTRVLPEIKSLVSLDLCGNNIGVFGACSLAKVLGKCKSLVCLKLLDNQIGSIGIEKIRQVYKGKRILKIEKKN